MVANDPLIQWARTVNHQLASIEITDYVQQ